MEHAITEAHVLPLELSKLDWVGWVKTILFASMVLSSKQRCNSFTVLHTVINKSTPINVYNISLM